MDIPKLPDSNKDSPSVSATATQHEPFYRKTGIWVVVLVILIVIIIIQHWPFGKSKNKVVAIPVVVATAQSADIPVSLSALGAVVPTYTVTVKTQINGQLLRVLYKEGQMVKKGDLLAEIDPRPYQAQLLQYEGQLMRDQALLDNARIDLKRYQTLWRQDSVAKQTLDTQVSLVNQYMGAVKFDQGQIQTIKVNLLYCEITSPVDGRVGLRLVDPGNYVQVSDVNGLAVIATLKPITVIFSIPEDDVPAVLEQINAGNTLTVTVYDRQQNKILAQGKLLTVDNQIDPTTGTVKLRAQFENQNNALFPNQFVNVSLLVKTLLHVTTLPTAAIQHGAQNNFVYLVQPNNTVSVKTIVAGVAFDEHTVINSGIVPGQVVVVEGADKLTEGASVIASAPTQPLLIPQSDLTKQHTT